MFVWYVYFIIVKYGPSIVLFQLKLVLQSLVMHKYS